MKTMNFKIYSLLIAVSAFLALSGCGSSDGTPPATPDAGTSTVMANPVSILADGTTTSTVTVTVNDANSNPMTNAAVSLAQTGSSTISAVTNEGDGTYTFTVTSTTPETETYTATADSVVITQTANVTFMQTEAQCLAAAGGYQAIVIQDINGIERTWLDRNLGASQAATDTNDSLAYGDYYQWGRYADGHEKNDSAVCDTLLATDLNGTDDTTGWYAQFIIPPSGPHDWVAAGVDDNGSLRSESWKTPYDDNQVCPCGYVVATEKDFKDLNITDTNVSNDFKLAYAGYRSPDSSLGGVDTMAIYWTSDTNGTNGVGSIPYDLIGDGRASDHKRAYGLPIRCIKP